MADKAIVKALHSNGTGPYAIGLNNDGDLIVGGRIVSPSPDKKIRLFDDFLGDVIADQWAVVEGADTATSDAVVTNGPGGILRLTTGDSATVTYAGNGIQITQGAFYNWQASLGGLRLEARIKIDDITLAAFFVGFTDVGTFEAPIESAGSANTITTNASDAVGFFYDTRMTDDNIWIAGVKGDTDATHVDTGTAPVNATYIRLAVEVDSSGNATFFINGDAVGKVTDAITAATVLTPTIAATSLDSGTSKNLDVDYIEVEQDRV